METEASFKTHRPFLHRALCVLETQYLDSNFIRSRQDPMGEGGLFAFLRKGGCHHEGSGHDYLVMERSHQHPQGSGR